MSLQFTVKLFTVDVHLQTLQAILSFPLVAIWLVEYVVATDVTQLTTIRMKIFRVAIISYLSRNLSESRVIRNFIKSLPYLGHLYSKVDDAHSKNTSFVVVVVVALFFLFFFVFVLFFNEQR